MTDIMTAVHIKLAHAVTEYDRKQFGKRGYNPYALGQYLQAVANVDEDLAAGMDLRKAIVSNFNGRLLDRCLKAVGLETSTIEEQRF
jgi:hypothetical protein